MKNIRIKIGDRIVTYSASTSVFGLLFIIFFILKVAGIGAVATWSWWWVTCPLWIPPLLFLVIFFFVFFIGVLARLLL